MTFSGCLGKGILWDSTYVVLLTSLSVCRLLGYCADTAIFSRQWVGCPAIVYGSLKSLNGTVDSNMLNLYAIWSVSSLYLPFGDEKIIWIWHDRLFVKKDLTWQIVFARVSMTDHMLILHVIWSVMFISIFWRFKDQLDLTWQIVSQMGLTWQIIFQNESDMTDCVCLSLNDRSYAGFASHLVCHVYLYLLEIQRSVGSDMTDCASNGSDTTDFVSNGCYI